MDEVAYWSRALTSAEVAQHWSKTQSGLDYFAAPLAGTPPPPLRLNEVGAPGSFFLELQNTGGTLLDIGGAYFNGITFAFTNGTRLASGAFFVLARNPGVETARASFRASLLQLALLLVAAIVDRLA